MNAEYFYKIFYRFFKKNIFEFIINNKILIQKKVCYIYSAKKIERNFFKKLYQSSIFINNV